MVVVDSFQEFPFVEVGLKLENLGFIKVEVVVCLFGVGDVAYVISVSFEFVFWFFVL